MNRQLLQSLWKQFGASIGTLGNAIRLCPPELWNGAKEFWREAYHSIFWLDYFLTLEPASFEPPVPFSVSEFETPPLSPNRVYTKDELLEYLRASRRKCYDLIDALDSDTLNSRWVNTYRDYSVFEILLYNMRHVQHHAAKLNLIVRQEAGIAGPWIWQDDENLYPFKKVKNGSS